MEDTIHLKQKLLQVDPKIELTTSEDIQEGEIVFHVASKEIIRLCPNGDIYIREKLTENDAEVVQGMREFLTEAKDQGL